MTIKKIFLTGVKRFLFSDEEWQYFGRLKDFDTWSVFPQLQDAAERGVPDNVSLILMCSV